ncbi:pyridoxamine 5'-phosphate oxidase family protein [Lysinimonas soli]|uniref:Pyridoxamine 5'-phosphate oxidase family protein n=1 Tax=Lysinimonas soli TaxID=1074233 RepID=A0ABW0NR46_9MICO
MPAEVEFESWSPQGPVTELSDEHCWRLLAEAGFGRLAVSRGDRPAIFPIDFRVADGGVVFRTAEGSTKLSDLLANGWVALEMDERKGTGASSVVLTGHADPVSDPDRISAYDRLPLPPWIPNRPYVYVRISPDSVHGRAFTRHLTVERTTPSPSAAGG